MVITNNKKSIYNPCTLYLILWVDELIILLKPEPCSKIPTSVPVFYRHWLPNLDIAVTNQHQESGGMNLGPNISLLQKGMLTLFSPSSVLD